MQKNPNQGVKTVYAHFKNYNVDYYNVFIVIYFERILFWTGTKYT